MERLRYRFTATRPEIPPIAEWRPFAEEAYAANWFTNFGALSLRLERVLQDRWGVPGGVCVAAANGTVAIAAPLIAHNVSGPVISPAFTFPATVSAIRMAGATPVLADVDAATWRVAPAALDAEFRRTGARAAILVCPFGLKSDWSAHIEVAREHGAVVVIDNAAGLGVAREPVEQSADVFEAYSMHATKPFGVGEGGAVFAHASTETALRGALNFGAAVYDHAGSPAWGINGKLAEMFAAIGLAVEQTFDARLARRRALAARYAERLGGLGITLSGALPAESSWQVFPALAADPAAAAAIVKHAVASGMEVRRYYRPALSALPAFAADSCPVSEVLAERMVCFPVYSNASAVEENEMLDIAARAVRRAREQA